MVFNQLSKSVSIVTRHSTIAKQTMDSFNEYGNTHSYKKVNHKKNIECKIDLLCNIFAKPDAHLDVFVRCINKIYNKRCNTQYKNKHHLQQDKGKKKVRKFISSISFFFCWYSRSAPYSTLIFHEDEKKTLKNAYYK